MNSKMTRRSTLKGMGAAALVATTASAPVMAVTSLNTQDNQDKQIVDHAAYISNLLAERKALIATREDTLDLAKLQAKKIEFPYTRDALQSDINILNGMINKAVADLREMQPQSAHGSSVKVSALLKCSCSSALASVSV